MSPKNAVFDVVTLPVKALEYRDMPQSNAEDLNTALFNKDALQDHLTQPRIEITNEELTARIQRERADAVHILEQRLKQEYEQKVQSERSAITSALTAFEVQRIEYFAHVESEVVQLALSIAAKILHREVQVDPMLLAALVKLAIERIREGSKVNIRVSSRQLKQWRDYFAAQNEPVKIQVLEDTSLSDLDCVLETEMGSANFGLDSQLKEVEQGFFDLLALRPANPANSAIKASPTPQ